FRMSCPGKNSNPFCTNLQNENFPSPGGDGLTFTIGTIAGTDTVFGSALGFRGGDAFAVEFDTSREQGFRCNNDPDDNHVGLDVRGVYNCNIPTYRPDRGPDDPYIAVIATPPFDLNSGYVITAWIDYDAPATTIRVYVADGDTSTKPGAPLLETTFNLKQTIGDDNAYVGFTAATTVCRWQNHDILNCQKQQLVQHLPSSSVSVHVVGKELMILDSR
ncbi:hypothetical protein KFL_014980010, partial [Klebsormidium nitens]